MITVLKLGLLVAESTIGSKVVSTSLTEVSVGGKQPMHNHQPEQCLYIIKGKGKALIGEEEFYIKEGDSVLIPSNVQHGIENIGNEILIYLAASSPTLGVSIENKMWPLLPDNREKL